MAQYAGSQIMGDPDDREEPALWNPKENYESLKHCYQPSRRGAIVDKIALLAFPWTKVDPSTVAATRRLLDRGDLNTQVRRSVTDAGDDLRRALNAQQKFGAAAEPSDNLLLTAPTHDPS
jgi:hypothetical protein